MKCPKHVYKMVLTFPSRTMVALMGIILLILDIIYAQLIAIAPITVTITCTFGKVSTSIIASNSDHIIIIAKIDF